jgi:alpha-beta hydrolase superfamily lysophospholipase
MISPMTVFAESVSFTGLDGQILKGEFLPSAVSSNAVIMLHMKGRTHQDLGFFADKLNQNHFAVLSYDMRGHGESLVVRDGKTIFWDDLTRADYQMLASDLQQAIRFVQSQVNTSSKVYLLGADLGATVILDFLSQAPTENHYNAILVSPGLDYGELDINKEKLDKLKGRDLLLVSGRDDAYSYFSCQYLIEHLNLKNNQSKFVWSARHGSALLFDDHNLANWLIKFLQKKGKS